MEKNIGRALVIAAMPEEAAAVAQLATDLSPLAHPFQGIQNAKQIQISTGKLGGKEIILVTSSIGAVAASAVHSYVATTQAVERVYSVGSCGGLARDIRVGEVVLGSRYAYSLADATAFGYAPGQVPGAPSEFVSDAGYAVAATRQLPLSVREGLMLSGDAFVTAELAEPMLAKFPTALSVDMESTAHAHTAYLLGLPFLAVRSVSDLCSPRAGEEFHIGLEVAAQNSALALAAILKASNF